MAAVSVIVPVYNVKDYVQECIDSILAQTFTDYEILIVDDASTDGSLALCRELYSLQPKVRIIEREPPGNEGLSRTRNLGLRLSRGEYISFIDSDDTITTDCLQRLYEAAEAEQADVAAAGLGIVRPDGSVQNLRFTEQPVCSRDRKARMEMFIQRRLGVQAWSKLYRRDFLQLHGLEFQDIRSEDELFAFITLWYAKSYVFLPDVLYHYRQTPVSIMRGQYPGKVKRLVYSSIEVMRMLETYIQRMPELLQDEMLAERIRRMFLGRFRYDTYSVCEKVPEEVWQAEAREAFRECLGQDASWAEAHYVSLWRAMQNEKAMQSKVQKLEMGQRIASCAAEYYRQLAESRGRMRIFLVGTPWQGNLGDAAIVLAESYILQERYPAAVLVEMPWTFVVNYLWQQKIADGIQPEETIFMHGGGNLGNLYPGEEELRRKFIRLHPDNEIIVMPQSICFTADEAGQAELQRSTAAYHGHPRLTLLVRDENSWQLAKRYFPETRSLLAPDAVLAMEGIWKCQEIERSGVCFFLRQDKEKVRSEAVMQETRQWLRQQGIPSRISDTTIPQLVCTNTERKQAVSAKLLEAAKARVVITDRFHGMVFSVLMHTPVLVLRSYDTKIPSGLKWVQELNWVHYIDQPDAAAELRHWIEYYTTGPVHIVENTSRVKEAWLSTWQKLDG